MSSRPSALTTTRWSPRRRPATSACAPTWPGRTPSASACFTSARTMRRWIARSRRTARGGAPAASPAGCPRKKPPPRQQASWSRGGGIRRDGAVGEPLGPAGQPPAFRVVLAGLARVRHRRARGAHFALLVRALTGRLLRAAVRLAPDQRDLGADLDRRVDDAERELLALVVAVAGEQRQSDDLAVEQHRVVVRRGVVRDRHVEALGRELVGEQRGGDLACVLAVPGQRHLAALRGLVERLERLAADEVVVEPHHVAVAELVGREVGVLDVARHEAAAERAGEALVADGREPLAVRLELLAGVNRGQRRGDPAGLQRVRGVGAGPNRHDAELLAGVKDRLADLEVLLVRAPDLKARLTGHAVPERVNLTALDVDEVGAEELNVRDRPAVQLRNHLGGVRALDLEAGLRAGDGLAPRARRGGGVP